MKAKYILLVIFAFGLTINAEAQLLKKMKKKAEQAAERAVMKKTEQIVTEKTEKTIDDVAYGKDKDSKVRTTESQSTSPNSAPSTQGMNTIDGSSKTSNLHAAYNFNWEFKMKIVTGKNDEIDMNYLINTDTKDYFGMEMSMEETKAHGDVKMVMDSKNKKTIMFMEGNGQKMAQVTKMPNPKADKKTQNMGYKEIGTKTILGYECFGIQVEDPQYTATLYYTLDAPINFSSIFAMANNKSTPKGFDPALIQVLAEESLLMEMNATHKKKSKESFTMTAQSLTESSNILKLSDYQVMSF